MGTMKFLIEKIKTKEQLQKDTKELVRVGKSAFGASMSAEEIIDHLDGDVLVAKAGDGKIAAFHTSLQDPGNSSLYISGVAVEASSQGNKLSEILHHRAISNALTNSCRSVSVRTQNPRIEKGITSTMKGLVASGDIRSFRIERAKRQGLYGRMLTDVKPTAGDAEPYADLDYPKGDAFVLTYHIEPK